MFYTSLYHALLQPLTGNDADGRYRGFDDRIHRALGWTYYEFFSLWDTYRTQNQLLALLRPARAKDVAKWVLAIHDQGGCASALGVREPGNDTMTGDPVTPFLVDLWRFGALSGQELEAYQALLQNSRAVPPAESPFQGRSGNPGYQKDGFVQYDPDFPKKGQDTDPNHGASATLEYALADCSLSIMATALGKNADAKALSDKARTYRTLWDPTVTDRGFTGFYRPKVTGGGWSARSANRQPAEPGRVPRGYVVAVPMADPAGRAWSGGTYGRQGIRRQAARRLLRLRGFGEGSREDRP